jgi:hypothetical protein
MLAFSIVAPEENIQTLILEIQSRAPPMQLGIKLEVFLCPKRA